MVGGVELILTVLFVIFIMTRVLADDSDGKSWEEMSYSERLMSLPSYWTPFQRENYNCHLSTNQKRKLTGATGRQQLSKLRRGMRTIIYQPSKSEFGKLYQMKWEELEHEPSKSSKKTNSQKRSNPIVSDDAQVNVLIEGVSPMVESVADRRRRLLEMHDFCSQYYRPSEWSKSEKTKMQWLMKDVSILALNRSLTETLWMPNLQNKQLCKVNFNDEYWTNDV